LLVGQESASFPEADLWTIGEKWISGPLGQLSTDSVAKGYSSFQSAWRTLEGIKSLNMIRKGRVRWVEKHDVVAELRFITKLFAIAA
jgi:hypothetical protein